MITELGHYGIGTQTTLCGMCFNTFDRVSNITQPEKNQILPSAKTWIDFEGFMPCEINHR